MPSFKDRYCSKHNIIYYDFMCPQCREDEEKKQLEKIIEPLKKAEQKRRSTGAITPYTSKVRKGYAYNGNNTL